MRAASVSAANVSRPGKSDALTTYLPVLELGCGSTHTPWLKNKYKTETEMERQR